MSKAVWFIILGATLWGTISWFVKHLAMLGISPFQIVILRSWTSAILLLLYFVIRSPKVLRLLCWKDIWYFIGTGVISIVFFNYCLFAAIDRSSIPVATALLYTAPAIVTILARLLFKEALSTNKIFALIITLIGTAFIIEVLPSNQTSISLSAFLFGIGSGVGYALYSIFSKFALKKYSSFTITLYTFLVAGITLTPFFPYREQSKLLMNPEVLFYAFGLGLFPTAIAYITYTYGLQQMEASKAAIFATIEPVVATFIGIFIFHELFHFLQGIGMIAIIGAVILIERERTKEENHAKGVI